MKKALIIILLLFPLFCFAQVCNKPLHAAISLTGATNQVISDYEIRPSSSIGIKLTNCSNITITRVKVVGSTNPIGAIDLENCHDITIYQAEVDSSIRGVYAHSCTNNIIIVGNWFKDILDPYVDTTPPGGMNPNGGGNSVQLSLTNGTGIKIDSNFIYHTANTAFNGDNISIYKSSGASGSRIKVWYNQILGGGSQTTSLGKAGIAVGDVTGGYQDIQFNKIKNSGSAGIIYNGGPGNIVSNNQIYSDPLLPFSAGIIYGAYGGNAPSTDAAISNNKINWRQANTNASAKFWDHSNLNSTQPTGWITNTTDGAVDGTITSSILSTPLWTNCVVIPTAPVISYSPNSNVYLTGTSITNKTPINTGGTVVSWSINKSLPAGLSFSTSTGVISGTPTTVTGADTYTITATNTGGSNSTTISITVNTPLASPTFTYSPSSNTYVTGMTITNKMPISTGGAIASFSISRSLPAGLFFNTGSGLISGTPTVTSSNTAYAITGTNASGSSTFTINLTVNAPVVSVPNISYTPSSNTFTYGITIPNLLPTNSGGTIASFSISPSLPSGLSFNTSTGLISGTPTTPHAATNYTITATNAGGNSTFVVSITVQKAPLVIIAVSTSKLPGHVNPTFEVIYSGFQFTDSSASLSTLPTVTTNAVTLSPPGVYPLVPGGAVSSNYSFSYVSGVLLIGTGPVISGSFGGIIRLSE